MSTVRLSWHGLCCLSSLEHYEKQRDVQTLAMITSVISLYENDKWRINSTKDRPVMSLRLLPEPPALARQKSSTSDSNTVRDAFSIIRICFYRFIASQSFRVALSEFVGISRLELHAWTA